MIKLCCYPLVHTLKMAPTELWVKRLLPVKEEVLICVTAAEKLQVQLMGGALPLYI